jgi:hypothetical protein
VTTQPSEHTGTPTYRLEGELVYLRPIESEDVPQPQRWRNDTAMTGSFVAPPPASLAQLQRRYCLNHPSICAVAH